MTCTTPARQSRWRVEPALQIGGILLATASSKSSAGSASQRLRAVGIAAVTAGPEVRDLTCSRRASGQADDEDDFVGSGAHGVGMQIEELRAAVLGALPRVQSGWRLPKPHPAARASALVVRGCVPQRGEPENAAAEAVGGGGSCVGGAVEGLHGRLRRSRRPLRPRFLRPRYSANCSKGRNILPLNTSGEIHVSPSAFGEVVRSRAQENVLTPDLRQSSDESIACDFSTEESSSWSPSLRHMTPQSTVRSTDQLTRSSSPTSEALRSTVHSPDLGDLMDKTLSARSGASSSDVRGRCAPSFAGGATLPEEASEELREWLSAENLRIPSKELPTSLELQTELDDVVEASLPLKECLLASPDLHSEPDDPAEERLLASSELQSEPEDNVEERLFTSPDFQQAPNDLDEESLCSSPELREALENIAQAMLPLTPRPRRPSELPQRCVPSIGTYLPFNDMRLDDEPLERPSTSTSPGPVLHQIAAEVRPRSSCCYRELTLDSSMMTFLCHAPSTRCPSTPITRPRTSSEMIRETPSPDVAPPRGPSRAKTPESNPTAKLDATLPQSTFLGEGVTPLASILPVRTPPSWKLQRRRGGTCGDFWWYPPKTQQLLACQVGSDLPSALIIA